MSKAERVAPTCDAWRSRATVTDEWRMSSHVFQTRALHDNDAGAHMAQLLNNSAEEWGITEKEPALVTYNASSMIVAAELVQTLKPVEVATWVMSDESNPTLSVTAPQYAQLLQATRESTS